MRTDSLKAEIVNKLAAEQSERTGRASVAWYLNSQGRFEYVIYKDGKLAESGTATDSGEIALLLAHQPIKEAAQP